MTSERWRRIERLYEAALQRAPTERGPFLDAACEGDETLRADVERLIAADDRAGDFLNAPAWEVAASAIAATKTTAGRAMPLVGAHIGPYEVLAPLGVGGMGEVYRARDTTLNRDVALKVLPDAFALDADRVARFRREANVLASLNHPNVAAIYGFEEAGDVKRPRAGTGRRPDAGRPDRARPSPARGRAADRPPDRRRARSGARARHRAPGFEARQHQGPPGRRRQSARLRAGQGGRAWIGGRRSLQLAYSNHAVATEAGLIIGSAAYMAPSRRAENPPTSALTCGRSDACCTRC